MRYVLHNFVDHYKALVSELEIPPSTGDLRSPIKDAMIRVEAGILRIVAFLKNSSFYEEREWRLVFPVLSERDLPPNTRCFRVANTTLIPYIAYPFSTDPDAPLPLVDVILGPDSHVNSVLAAQSFLGSKGIKHLIPRQSAVPFQSL